GDRGVVEVGWGWVELVCLFKGGDGLFVVSVLIGLPALFEAGLGFFFIASQRGESCQRDQTYHKPGKAGLHRGLLQEGCYGGSCISGLSLISVLTAKRAALK